jgi:adenine-specific DNA-methyltransferase
MKLDEELKQNLVELVKQDKPIPLSYKNLLFPLEGRQAEYELIYGCKERKEDILADTWSVPFQIAKRFGEVKEGEWHNKLIFGDNLQALKFMMKDPEIKGNVRLVYIDPPFGTGELYDAKGAPAYSAALQGAAYLEFLRKRLILLEKLLANDGSIYVRIDYHFGHYIKVLMDEIFDKNNFQGEIVLNRFKKKSNVFTTTTESLFFYSKNPYPNFFFKSIQRPRQCTFCKSQLEPKWQWISSAGESKTPKYFVVDGKRILLYPPRGRHWTNSQEKIDELHKEGKIRI